MQHLNLAANSTPSLVQSILAITIPNNSGASHAGNWPSSAVFAVDYRVHDKQFPNVEHEPSTSYFDSISDLLAWFAEKRDWIKGTDYDFSMNYTVYTWDWGPVRKYSKSM